MGSPSGTCETSYIQDVGKTRQIYVRSRSREGCTISIPEGYDYPVPYLHIKRNHSISGAMPVMDSLVQEVN